MKNTQAPQKRLHPAEIRVSFESFTIEHHTTPNTKAHPMSDTNPAPASTPAPVRVRCEAFPERSPLIPMKGILRRTYDNTLEGVSVHLVENTLNADRSKGRAIEVRSYKSRTGISVSARLVTFENHSTGMTATQCTITGGTKMELPGVECKRVTEKAIREAHAAGVKAFRDAYAKGMFDPAGPV